MKRKTQIFLESMNSALNEKINKDNIEINKALANPNLGKNKDKIKAAGYDVKYDGDLIQNPKTGKYIMPKNYNRDEKKKVDFKGKLDSTRNNMEKSFRRNSDIEYDKIPKSIKTGKTDAGGMFNSNEIEHYSSRMVDDDLKSISNNVNDYKNAVKTRDDEAKHADRLDKNTSYYEKKVADAQQELDWHKDYAKKTRDKSDAAEEKRKEIIAKLREKKNKNESALTEDSYEQYQSVVNTIDNAISNLDNVDDIQELLQNIIGICKDIADDKGLFIESSLTENTKYNTKSKEEYEDEESYKDAIHGDISVIMDVVEDLKYKMNTDEAVEVLNTHLNTISSDILDKGYNN